MFKDTARRAFDTPDTPAVDHVVIYDHDGDHPFRATQFYERTDAPFGDGDGRWLDERDEYTLTEEYLEAVAENTHIPTEDIRLEPLPVEVGTI